jgi:hypothetical protein
MISCPALFHQKINASWAITIIIQICRYDLVTGQITTLSQGAITSCRLPDNLIEPLIAQ